MGSVLYTAVIALYSSVHVGTMAQREKHGQRTVAEHEHVTIADRCEGTCPSLDRNKILDDRPEVSTS